MRDRKVRKTDLWPDAKARSAARPAVAIVAPLVPATMATLALSGCRLTGLRPPQSATNSPKLTGFTAVSGPSGPNRTNHGQNCANRGVGGVCDRRQYVPFRLKTVQTPCIRRAIKPEISPDSPQRAGLTPRPVLPASGQAKKRHSLRAGSFSAPCPSRCAAAPRPPRRNPDAAPRPVRRPCLCHFRSAGSPIPVASNPPSAARIWPVTKLASSPSRKQMAAAISFSVP